MTTVVDPLGTPSPVYNRSGTTIVNLTASGTDQSSATPITAVSGHTIVLVSTPFSSPWASLPSPADIGDVVEVYVADQNSTAIVSPVSGETIDSGARSSISLDTGVGAIFRKTSATDWRSIVSS